MVTWVALEPLSATVEAGGETDVSLRIRNTSDIVEEYHVDVVGDPALWCTAEPSTLRLYPGTTGTVRLTFAPRKGPDPAAGPHPYGVRVRPAESPDAVTVSEGSVSVLPFTDVRAELLPVIVRGWRRAKPRLVVDNYGNATVTAAVRAAVQDSSVDFDTRTPSFQVPPGRAHFGVLEGRPRRLLWFGQKVRHPFTTTVVPSGGEPLSVAGTYLQTTLLPTWLARLFALLAALAMVFAGLWFFLKPSVASHAVAEALSSPASQQTASSSAPPGSAPSPAPGQQSSPGGQSAPAHQSGGAGQSAPAAPPASIPKPSAPPKPKTPAKLPKPLGLWKLNGGVNSPATTAADTGTGHHPATGHNAMWCSGQGCAWLNGANADFVTSGPVLKTGPGSSFTVSAWVFLQNIPPHKASATAVSQSGKTQSAFTLQYNGVSGCWAFARGSGRATGCGGHYSGKWVYLTGVFNAPGKKMRLYVNGQLKSTKPAAAPAASSGPLVLGRALFNNKPADWWKGCLKDVEVFGRPLTKAQIRTLYSSP